MSDNTTPSTLHNIEAEQALLGALLVHNEGFDRVRDVLAPEHFADAVHRRIFERISRKVEAGDRADPVTLRALFADDEGLSQLGGPSYLGRLAAACVTPSSAREYALIVAGLWRKRETLAALDAARDAIAAAETPEPAAMALEAQLAAISEGARRSPLLVPWATAVAGAVDEVLNAYQSEGDPRAVATGIKPLDEQLGGLFPGELALLGGRPGMGKSAIALSVALHAAEAGKGVLFASLEMPAADLAKRGLASLMAARGLRIPYRDARRGRITEAQVRGYVESAADLTRLPIQMTPPSVRSVDALSVAIRRAARAFERQGCELGLIVFDYIQIADGPGARDIDRVGAISKALKVAALRHAVPVLALSQLSRAVESREDKRPMLSDLRESGQLEQDADVIMFAYRDEYYLERTRPQEGSRGYSEAVLEWHEAMERARGWLEVIIAKQRMGDVGTARVKADLAVNRLDPHADRRPEPAEGML